MHSTPKDLTEICLRISRLNDTASAELLPFVYEQLKRRARAYLPTDPITLQATDLVHEAFAQLIEPSKADFATRAHFIGVAAKAMRHILVDHVRKRKASKRGGDWNRVSVTAAAEDATAEPCDLLTLNDALEKLSVRSPRMAEVVELRFFGGATIAETAAALGVSHSTVEDDWAFTRAWLRREVQGSSAD